MSRLLFSFAILLVSCKSREEENWDDLQHITLGMKYQMTDSIMRNPPKSIENAFWNDSLSVNYYESPAAASDDYAIVYTKKDSIVSEIKYGD
jgi:hypothetical protein